MEIGSERLIWEGVKKMKPVVLSGTQLKEKRKWAQIEIKNMEALIFFFPVKMFKDIF